jgi:hypothetical protein
MLINSPNISGSLTVTGNATISGSLNVAGGINATITGSATSASYVEYSNVANKPTLVSGSSQITYSGLSGIPAGIVSGSSQVSFNGITDKPTLVSGSSQITYSGISSIPSGIVSGSSQISFTGIVDKPTLVSGSSQIIYSEISSIPAGIVSSSAQIAGYNLFATTGSNQFNGSQAITGSLTVTGQVVAQTLNVQQVTSSIVYSSGSNVFGNSLSNTQQFTGSLQVSGSSHYVLGNLLIGKTNDEGFALDVNGTGRFLSNSSSTIGLIVGGAGGAGSTRQGQLRFGDAGTVYKIQGGEDYSAINFMIGTGTPLTLASNGAATFSSSVTAGGNFLMPAGSGLAWSGDATRIITPEDNVSGALIQTPGIVRFNVGGTTERMRITAGGNVGIGTTSPNAQLDAYTSQGGSTIAATHGTGGSYPKASGISFGATSTSLTVSNNGGNTTFTGGAGIYASNGAASDNPTNLVFWTTSGGSPTTRLTIASGGAATFSSSVTAGSDITSRTSLNAITLSNTEPYVFLARNSGSNGIGVIRTLDGGALAFDNGATGAAQSTKMTITAGGNVGIGTDSPNNLLQVGGTANGIIRIDGAGDNTDFGIKWASSNASIYSNTGNAYLTFATNGSERMRITSGGNVGIGTTSPSGKLDVFSSSDVYTNISTSGNNTSAVLSLYSSTGVSDGAAICYNVAMRFGTVTGLNGAGFTERMRITSGGNVGIGTTSPDRKLGILVSPSSTGDDGINITNGSSSFILTRTGSSYTYRGVPANAGMIYSGANLAFLSDGTNTTFHNGNGETMRITSGGNVGIGTTPSYKLDVNGSQRWIFRNSSSEITDLLVSTESANSISKLSFLWYGNETAALKFHRGDDSTGSSISLWTQPTGGSTTERIRIRDNGNIGIGTTSPGATLDVNGSIYVSGEVSGRTFPFNTTIGAGADATTTTIRAGSTSGFQSAIFLEGGNVSNTIKFNTASAERMRITSTGYVAIVGNQALNNPPYLQGMSFGWNKTNGQGESMINWTNAGGGISPDLTFNYWDNSAFSERMRITSGGNVGIGNTDPSAKLHISGTSPLRLTGGGITKQYLVNSKTAASSGTALKLFYVGFSHAVRLYLYIIQNSSNIATAVADFTTTYGASTGGITQSSRIGNISSISANYNNGGTPDYTIDVTVNYTGTAPTIYAVIEGISNDNMYLVT